MQSQSTTRIQNQRARSEGVQIKENSIWFEAIPKAWNKRISSFLIEEGFTKCVSEHGMYVNNAGKLSRIIICLYVDDLLITSANKT